MFRAKDNKKREDMTQSIYISLTFCPPEHPNFCQLVSVFISLCLFVFTCFCRCISVLLCLCFFLYTFLFLCVFLVLVHASSFPLEFFLVYNIPQVFYSPTLFLCKSFVISIASITIHFFIFLVFLLLLNVYSPFRLLCCALFQYSQALSYSAFVYMFLTPPPYIFTLYFHCLLFLLLFFSLLPSHRLPKFPASS